MRGLNKTGRYECLKDFINLNFLDFVGIQETKKDSFHQPYLEGIRKNFNWNFLPARGTAGGVLVGINSSKFDILSWDIRNFCVAMHIRNSCDNLSWRLVTIYGPAYDEHKQEFLEELHNIMENWDGPTLLGGDFNLIRSISDKNNDNINYHWSDSFNDWINQWNLIEIKNPSRTYTWTNNQEQPVMAVLDRVLTTTDLEAHYPLISVKAIPRVGSDHVPLVVNFGTSHNPKPYLFCFEKWWLTQEGFHDLVRNSWNLPCHETNPLDTWHCKLKRLRQHLKGWSLNVNADLKRKKQSLLQEFDILDVFSETNSLEEEDRERMRNISRELDHIWSVEEIKAKQRSRDRNISEGDRNTAYFQALANQRHRKKKIGSLQGPEGETSDNREMLDIATSFYKHLFGYESKPDIHLGPSFWKPEEKVTVEENTILDAPLSEEEIKFAIFSSYADGAPGPDGFPFLFYQNF